MEPSERYNIILERYKNLADKAYANYSDIAGKYEEPDYDVHVEDPNLNCVRLLTPDEFFDRCKTDTKFSEKWDVSITERPMTFEEQIKWVIRYTDVEMENLYITEKVYDKDTPTKIVTLFHGGAAMFTFK